MEANVMVKAHAATANVNTRQVNRTQPAAPARVTAPAAQPVQSQSGTINTPAQEIADMVSAAGVDILNAHPRVNFGTAEQLMTSEFTTPISDRDITDSMLNRYLNSVNIMIEPSFTRLNFNVHEATGRVEVQVIDTSTDEVIREIPPESRLDTLARIQELIGLLFDETS